MNEVIQRSKAEELQYDQIFRALKKGDFYASTGPEFFELSVEKGIVTIKSSPVAHVCLSTACRKLYSKRACGDGLLSEVCFDISDYLRLAGDGIHRQPYIRITLVDKSGNTAYSRAYFMEELLD